MSTVNETLVSRKMQLSVNAGTDVNGNAVVRNRSYNNINPDATPANIHATAVAIASLMDNTVTSIYYDEKMLLEEVSE